MTLSIGFNKDGTMDGRMTWDSGTGCPSRFLSIENLLTANCSGSGVLESGHELAQKHQAIPEGVVRDKHPKFGAREVREDAFYEIQERLTNRR